MTKSNCIQFLLALLMTHFSISISAQSNVSHAIAKVENLSISNDLAEKNDYNSTIAVQEIRTHIKNNLVFPELAAEYRFEGIVELLVSVDEHGLINKYEIKNNQKDLFSKQVIKSIKDLKKITPIYKNGIAKKSTISIPVRFKS